MLKQAATFDDVYRGFSWDIPEFYNIGFDICDKWAKRDSDLTALIDIGSNGEVKEYSFSDLKHQSNRLANLLLHAGIGRKRDETGDRVGVLLPQCMETAVAHTGALKAGCVSIPLSVLFGKEALVHRLIDSEARAVITNKVGAAKLASMRTDLPDLELVLCIEGKEAGATCFHSACAEMQETFDVVKTRSDDPAILIYTSGTTGNPKGALLPHRVLLGHLPGVEISHNFLPREFARLWSPADWAWIGGLLDVMMPALHHGIPVIARRFEKFTGKAALELLRDQKITNTFLPPTALKLMKLEPDAERYELNLRSVASGGESLGTELIEWGEKVFGTTINEFYGQTECNMVVSSCSQIEPVRAGAIGRAVPGHNVEIIDAATGTILLNGREGAIAILSPDPVMFLEYWKNPQATRDKYVEGPEGKWLLTGDRGHMDAAGRIHFLGRDDDVISSAGYRIGPAEVEDCLIGHEAVLLAGVVGKPDPVRGSIVAAYLTLRDGFEPSEALAVDIANYVKKQLAAYEYPRGVKFIDDMPMTTTGKIIRGELRRMAMEETGKE